MSIKIEWDSGTEPRTPEEKNAVVEVELNRFDQYMQRMAGNEPLIPQERRLIQSFLTAHLSGKIQHEGT